MERGKFIVLEGIDGSGKTTQLKRLESELKKRGVACAAHREPTDGAIGRILRDALQAGAALQPETLALLFAADRLEHVTAGIIPLLESGVCVLCDRFIHSSMAYQSFFMPMERIIEYNRAAAEKLTADMTIFIDTPPSMCRRRMTESREQLELFESMDIADSIRGNYFRAFDALGENVAIIDGSKDEDGVFAELYDTVELLHI